MHPNLWALRQVSVEATILQLTAIAGEGPVIVAYRLKAARCSSTDERELASRS